VIVFDHAGHEAGRLEGRDGDETLRLPNSAVISRDERYLYVSDTRRSGGPGVWRFDLQTGRSELWMRESCRSANGVALDPAGTFLYLVESHLPGVSRIPIRADGSAGPKELAVMLPHDEPDGLAFNSRGELFIAIYHPSRIYRWQPATGQLDLVIEDATTDWLHHPTNLAFRGERELFCTNFGAWHLTRVDLTRLDQ
jgi:sugar lactone lactonase YvrE